MNIYFTYERMTDEGGAILAQTPVKEILEVLVAVWAVLATSISKRQSVRITIYTVEKDKDNVVLNDDFSTRLASNLSA